ncbi:putative Calcium/calmodulin-dependent protein kinase kinase 1 [Blattamonas nauphoetae]|uniref:Calcium/calmodulin-dependent protein kinase kinase 1 n=1 Tax=Blattamonas nauphoetae TaxID=2049346 RepID=A0ABQ9YMG7_9EUKA|nr:putative Calcium/calmodulin-dependent protein kinase kinase 1 [Blattamonas nauphoetae]
MSIPTLVSNDSDLNTPRTRPETPLVVTTEQFEKQKNEETGHKILNQYVIVKTIGQGAYGKVKLLTYASDPDERFAMKVIKKSTKRRGGAKKAENDSATNREIAIMKKINHVNLVRLFEVIDNPQRHKLYMVMEFIDGGSVYDDDDPPLDEETARIRMKQIVTGLAYLHMQNIVHHDIKPDNILMTKDGTCKISDFGVSMYYEDREAKILGIRGTPAFIPPEACCVPPLADGYNPFGADIWALGVLLFYFLFGRPPFLEDTVPLTYQVINEEEIPWHKYPEKKAELSEECILLIEKLLDKDPVNRIMMDELIVDSWLTKYGEDPIDLIADKIVVTDKDIEAALTPIIKWTTLVNLQMMVRRRAKRARANIAARKLLNANNSEAQTPEPKSEREITTMETIPSIVSPSHAATNENKVEDNGNTIVPNSPPPSELSQMDARLSKPVPNHGNQQFASPLSTALTVDTELSEQSPTPQKQPSVPHLFVPPARNNPVMQTYTDQPFLTPGDRASYLQQDFGWHAQQSIVIPDLTGPESPKASAPSAYDMSQREEASKTTDQHTINQGKTPKTRENSFKSEISEVLSNQDSAVSDEKDNERDPVMTQLPVNLQFQFEDLDTTYTKQTQPKSAIEVSAVERAEQYRARINERFVQMKERQEKLMREKMSDIIPLSAQHTGPVSRSVQSAQHFRRPTSSLVESQPYTKAPTTKRQKSFAHPPVDRLRMDRIGETSPYSKSLPSDSPNTKTRQISAVSNQESSRSGSHLWTPRNPSSSSHDGKITPSYSGRFLTRSPNPLHSNFISYSRSTTNSPQLRTPSPSKHSRRQSPVRWTSNRSASGRIRLPLATHNIQTVPSPESTSPSRYFSHITPISDFGSSDREGVVNITLQSHHSVSPSRMDRPQTLFAQMTSRRLTSQQNTMGSPRLPRRQPETTRENFSHPQVFNFGAIPQRTTAMSRHTERYLRKDRH